MYKSISIDTIIAKVIRDTRLVDNSYVSDFYEWIPEAMELMHTNAPLVPQCQVVKINYHVGKLPCGLIYIDAVEYEGQRMGYYTGVRHPAHIPSSTRSEETSAFTSVITSPTNAATGNMMYDSDLVASTAEHGSARYQLYLGHIATTFSDGEVKVHYRAMATDDRGLPLVPDHPDYKEALYWYVRMKMIQSGYDDPMYRNDDRMANQRWELHAARAISDITYPTPDEKEAQLAMHVRFVPPTDYWGSFFNSQLGEGPIGL